MRSRKFSKNRKPQQVYENLIRRAKWQRKRITSAFSLEGAKIILEADPEFFPCGPRVSVRATIKVNDDFPEPIYNDYDIGWERFYERIIDTVRESSIQSVLES